MTVDASQAGSGNLEVAVNGGRVQTSAESLGNNRYVSLCGTEEDL